MSIIFPTSICISFFYVIPFFASKKNSRPVFHGITYLPFLDRDNCNYKYICYKDMVQGYVTSIIYIITMSSLLYCDEVLSPPVNNMNSYQCAVRQVRDHGVHNSVNQVLDEGEKWLDVMEEALDQLLQRAQQERRLDRLSPFDLSQF